MMDAARTHVLEDSAFRAAAVPGRFAEIATSSFGMASLTHLPPETRLAAHNHDTPYLSIYLLGGYRERNDDLDVVIDAPSAAFHPAGAEHEDVIGPEGLRTLVIQFDPDWLKRAGSDTLPDRSTYWTVGPVAAEARRFARCVLGRAAPSDIIERAAGLAGRWRAQHHSTSPAWLPHLEQILRDEPSISAATIAARLRLGLPWMLRAYRALRGEGLADRLRRRALERALTLIETTERPLAEVAVECGFYDQSHLNRACRLALGLSPGELRAESDRRI